MKNIILFLSLAIAATFIGCIDKTPLTEEQQVYAGKWVANDGTYIHIYNNGGGDLKTSNKSVEGGKTTFTDDNTFEIGLFGIKKEYNIDAPPYEENGEVKIKLDGYVYTRQ